MAKFRDYFPEHDLASISPEEVLSFLTSLNGKCKQLAKHTRYAYLKALFNFIHNNLDAQFHNPCDTPMLKKLFRPGKLAPVGIVTDGAKSSDSPYLSEMYLTNSMDRT